MRQNQNQNQNQMKRRISALVICFILFALYRVSESWFYEPLHSFFHHQTMPIPKIEKGLYLFEIGFKMLINFSISYLCIALFFRSKKYNKSALKAFLYVGISVYILYVFQVIYDFPFGKMFGYYTRRVLIHPLLLLVLLASFYFDSRKNP